MVHSIVDLLDPRVPSFPWGGQEGAGKSEKGWSGLGAEEGNSPVTICDGQRFRNCCQQPLLQP